MSRNLILAVGAFALLGLAAAWNGRQVRETLGQVEAQVVGANDQRMRMGKLNADFTTVEGRPRLEDSVVALMSRVSPWMVSSTPSLAGAAVGQVRLRDTIWRVTSWGAERGLEVFENAQILAAGHFDLALVMVAALPLVILFAPRNDAVLMALGPAVSLVGILLSGAPLTSADTWIRTAVWLMLTAVYGALWLSIRQRVPGYWLAGVAYAVVVLLVPGVALLLAALVSPAPSRIAVAQQVQTALRPVMDTTSRELAPFYESHPEYMEDGHSTIEYDRLRLKAEAERHAAVTPILKAAEDSASGHRSLVKALSMLSPAAILHLALLETAGTGTSRQEAFEEGARAFGEKWAAEVKARIARERPLRSMDLAQLPTFQYQEQSIGGWLVPVGIGLAGLVAWLFAVRLLKAAA